MKKYGTGYHEFAKFYNIHISNKCARDEFIRNIKTVKKTIIVINPVYKYNLCLTDKESISINYMCGGEVSCYTDEAKNILSLIAEIEGV